MCLIVARLPITHHGHNKRERSTGTVVLIRIEENPKTIEVVCRAKDRSLCCALLGEPQGESITVQVTISVDTEFKFNLRSLLDHAPFNFHVVTELTSQFVAVRGTREKAHPCCDGRSEVRRTYLVWSTQIHPQTTLTNSIHTDPHERWYHPQNRTSGFGNRNRGRAVRS